MRIAIVNDTQIAVEAIRRVLATVPDYKLAWVAWNGAEAVAKCAIDRPDLILMDLVMPVMDGVEATYRIMTYFPCAIVVVTAGVSAQVSKVFEAMGYGALDAVNVPTLAPGEQTESSTALLSKIATIAKLLGKSALRKCQSLSKRERYPIIPKPMQPRLIAIGASSGGPGALKTILSRLPANFSAAIAIIQHIDVVFAPGLVEWLNENSPLKVELAKQGSRLEAGKVFVAGTNDRLILSSELTFSYTPESPDCFYRPSIDAFFQSVAKKCPLKGVGVVLTGMGKDGAAGLLSMRRAGWLTIAQDRESCAIYGMPKAAAELGAAARILPLEAIAPALVNFCS